MNIARIFRIASQLTLVWLVPIAHAQTILNYFKADVHADQILLEWEMTQGNTCNGIQILHGFDETPASLLHEISGICGSKLETIRYQYAHQNPEANREHHYQLIFGNLGSSEIISVYLRDFQSGYHLAPNPIQTEGRLHVQKNQPPYSIEWFNANGQRLKKERTEESYFHIMAQDFENGFFLYQIFNAIGTPIANGRVIIQNP